MYWILTQCNLSSHHKRILRLLGLSTYPFLNTETFVGRLTAPQVQLLRLARWVRWVERDNGTFRALSSSTDEESAHRKQYMRTIVSQAAVPMKGRSLPAGTCFVIIGYESDGTPIAFRVCYC